jgi:hypothetical protein
MKERGDTPEGVGTLSAHGAFVVHFRPDMAAGGAVSGRIEHVVSGKAARFNSVEDLLAFVDRVLREVKDASHSQ